VTQYTINSAILKGMSAQVLHHDTMGQDITHRLSLFQWIVGFFFIELIWTFLGGGATYLLLRSSSDHGWNTAPWGVYLIQHANFLILFGAIALFVAMALRTGMVRYITDATRFRWPLFRFGLFVWLGGLVIATTAGVLWNPRSFSVNPPGLLRDRIFLMTLAIVLTPLQCIAEELLFRTTLWRMLARRVKRPWIMSLASAIVFTIAHLANTEVQESPVAVLVLAYYALSGFLFMEMTWRLGGTEAAFGAHIANNIFLVLVANYVGSSLPGDPWFLQEGPVLWVDFIVLLLCSALILRRGKRYQYTALP